MTKALPGEQSPSQGCPSPGGLQSGQMEPQRGVEGDSEDPGV